MTSKHKIPILGKKIIFRHNNKIISNTFDCQDQPPGFVCILESFGIRSECVPEPFSFFFFLFFDLVMKHLSKCFLGA